MPTERILVTDALPYANGGLHLGHVAGSHLPGDIYVRYQRLKGRDVIHIGGTDDHGVPITLAAEREGISPQELVGKYYQSIARSLERAGIVFDNFSQTSRPIHHETARAFFTRLYERGWFVPRETDQLYCVKDQRFLPDRYVEGTCPHCGYPRARGDQCESCGTLLDAIQLIDPKCQICFTIPEVRKTTHWYFLLTRAEQDLAAWLETKSHWKDNVRHYCAEWLRQGLEDRPITRDIEWGIPVPLAEAAGKVIYVWFEALIGYISSTKEWAARTGQPDRWKDYWLNPDCTLVHCLGKDNIVFHAILWPAMLMAHGDFVLPAEVPANEFLNIEGQKLSTSRNWAIWLEEFLEEFPPDPLRYYLAAIAPETKDTDFAWKDFQARNNNELADSFGNFINRSLTFIARYADGRVPPPGDLQGDDRAVLDALVAAPDAVGACFESFQVRAAVRELIRLGNQLNKYFNDQEPWRTRKTAPDRCAATLYVCAQAVRSLAILMAPITPFSSEKVWTMLALPGRVDTQRWDNAADQGVPAGHQIGKPEILFTKIEDAVIDAQIAKLGRPAGGKEGSGQWAVGSGTPTPPAQTVPSPAAESPSVPPDTISLAEFQRLDLRVAEIVAAERVEKADKLLRLRIRIGSEERQIVAGIARQYSPDRLVGTKIIVVANLQPTTIRGIESQGMLLAAADEDGVPLLLRPDGDVPAGAKVK
ncbi:MAG: methionine--tRNA ligase [Candidatus Latescibacteria bacterium]|nr:methionine--tRNA ligase [Candidatus Latescibacterota bacterium]